MSDWFIPEKNALIHALERIATALEERLPPIEDANKIEALQNRITYLENHLKIAEDRLKRANLPDYGVRCYACGNAILGVNTVAGTMQCFTCAQQGRT